jgi:hypothetical protein
LNVNTLNTNNNVYDSVVTPPRMADLAMWLTADHTTTTAVGASDHRIDTAHDRSGKGNDLTQTVADNKPQLRNADGQFGGKRVMKFEHATSKPWRIENLQGTVNVQSIFGTDASPTTDPEFTVAMVLNETANSNGTEVYFSLNEATLSDPDKVLLMRHNNGAGFRVNGADAQFDTSQIDFTQGTAVTAISVLQDIGTSMSFYQWIGGVSCDWDDAGIGVDYPCDPDVMFPALIPTVASIGAHETHNSVVSEWFGEIAECLVWKGAHSGAEITETLNYLRDKWDCS